MDLPVSTIKDRLKICARQGLLGFAPVLPSFEVTRTSRQYDKNGDVKQETIEQKPERGQPENLPPKFVLDKITIQSDGTGRTVQTWRKATREELKLQEFYAALDTSFSKYDGLIPTIPSPVYTNTDLITLYPIIDAHHGLLSWGVETGYNYDTARGFKLHKEKFAELVSRTPESETAILMNIGDYFHVENNDNRTHKSGNPQDADSRAGKVQELGVDQIVDFVTILMQKHDKVIVKHVPGNHDFNLTPMLKIATKWAFHGNPRVEIVDHGPIFVRRFDRVLISAVHGDYLKPENLAKYIAGEHSDLWGQTEFRYGWAGHIHHRSKGGDEKEGFIWETLQTLVAKDAWSHANGFVSGRSMTAITYHRKYGEWDRKMVSVTREEAKLH
jgi:hypothetical protein